MKLIQTERDNYIEFHFSPENIPEAAMLLRMVKSSKKKKQRILVTFSSDIGATICIDKMPLRNQENYLTND